jgi:hypothetical protein
MKDLSNELEIAVSLAPTSRTADTDGTGVDLQGFEGAVIEFQVGAEGVTLSGTDKITLEIEESDDNVTFTDVAAADLVGEESAGVVKTLDDNAEAPANYSAGYIGSKRYIRGVLNYAGTHGAGTVIGCTVIKGKARHTA